MLTEELTLEELSERTGVEPRTLRSWVSEGLLSPPFKPGRGARYPGSNADRALAIRALKELHGLTLAEIGKRFMMASEEEIRSWALEAGKTLVRGGSARDYIRRIHQEAKAADRNLPQDDLFKPESGIHKPSGHTSRKAEGKSKLLLRRHARAEQRQEELANIERLIFQLEEVLQAPAPRRSRGAIWTRISVTPDLELSIRGELTRSERALFEQLADQFRAILTGGSRNDRR